MEEFYEILAACPLFVGIERAQLPGVMGCLGGRTVQMTRGQLLFSEGDRPTTVGVVVRGGVQVVREDYAGSRSLMAHIGPGGVFGESYACAGVEALPVSVMAESDGAVLLLDCGRIVSGCSDACGIHGRVLQNLLRLTARKNLELSRRMQILSRRTTREKLLAYLLSEAKRRGSREFTIPFDRQALADYLEVDRSGLSVEIGKLRREGRIRCEKSRFCLL